MIIIGVDPDSNKSGVAMFVGGKLCFLDSCDLLYILRMLEQRKADMSLGRMCELHIENVCGNNAAFTKRGIANMQAATAISRSVGKCQQVQVEIERIAERYGIPIVRHKISSMWKKDKAQFEKVTGWTGRSNEDTRSAAYFGWLGAMRKGDL